MVFKKTVIIATSADVSKNGSECFLWLAKFYSVTLIQQEIAECYLRILLQGVTFIDGIRNVRKLW